MAIDFSNHGKSAFVLDNSDLIITYDGLVDGHPLPVNKVADALAKEYGNYKYAVSRFISKDICVNVKVGKDSQKFSDIQSFTGLGMDREHDANYSGGNGAYAVNLPGRMTYQDVTIAHLFTRDTFFLKWLRNGAMKGGASRADIEIQIINKWAVKASVYTVGYARTMTFTLHDAFPIKWELSEDLDKNNSSALLMEMVTLTYSRITFQAKDSVEYIHPRPIA